MKKKIPNTEKTFDVALLTNVDTFHARSQSKSKLLSGILFDFIHAICKANGIVNEHPRFWDLQFYVQVESSFSGNKEITYTVNEATFKALFALRNKLEKGLTNLYEEGEKQGRNVLFQLNKGSISMDEFNSL